MDLRNYPSFSPPESLASKSHRDWSRKEAQSYFDWLMGCLDERVATVLRFVGIQYAERVDPRDLLSQAGAWADRALRDPACSKSSGSGMGSIPVLTNIGYSVAADLGLLTATQIVRTVGDKVHWEIVRKPKSDVSYNLPVLAGFGRDTYDPIGVSVADAAAVLAGRRYSDVWARVFDSCIADAKK